MTKQLYKQLRRAIIKRDDSKIGSIARQVDNDEEMDRLVTISGYLSAISVLEKEISINLSYISEN